MPSEKMSPALINALAVAVAEHQKLLQRIGEAHSAAMRRAVEKHKILLKTRAKQLPLTTSFKTRKCFPCRAALHLPPYQPATHESVDKAGTSDEKE
ncbi:hypothetical protein DIPPA_52390 [Diplonema papillatum]|nr:hypothetical protein DIPPA_52390 [Diplonema papillatum]